jgi:hypothetical protein
MLKWIQKYLIRVKTRVGLFPVPGRFRDWGDSGNSNLGTMKGKRANKQGNEGGDGTGRNPTFFIHISFV